MARALSGLLLIVATTVACNQPSDTRPPPPPNFRVVLHDAPSDDVDQVWITIDEMSVYNDDVGWMVVDTDVHTVDLKALTAGNDATLALTTLDPGTYSQIRLHVIASRVVVDGVDHGLEIPSGDTSGIKLHATFEMPDCGQLLITLDWDLAAHLHANPAHGYVLRPTIDVETTYDDSTCCPDPPCTAPGNCYVTARAVATDRGVADAVAAGVCVVVDELPATTPQSAKPSRGTSSGDPDQTSAHAAGDADDDGVPDDLEDALARRFFPNLNLHWESSFSGVANADRSLFYGENSYWPGTVGNMAFAARLWGGGTWAQCPDGENRCIEIRYTLPYNWDLGDPDFFGVTGHRGDSEFYAVLLQRGPATTWDSARNDPGAWYRIMDFMAAHKCASILGISGDKSRFRWSSPSGGPAYVWVAEGKHAAYPTQSACNGGIFSTDDCSDHRVWIPRAAAAAKLHNAGSPGAPMANTIPYPGGCKTCAPSGAYDVWDAGQGFADSSAYGKHMRGCMWWDTGSYGCEVCPYGNQPPPSGGGCAATGDACGQAPDGCWCDPACIELGDCCPDACSACGICAIACGDGVCQGTEDTCCPQDCPQVCGDGVCGGGESCTSCPGDCPDCDATPACGGTCADTGGACGQAPSGCWCDDACVVFKDCCTDSCSACGSCPPACGDGTCEPDVEDNCNCPNDCPPVCGNGTCDCQETAANCPSECANNPVCGDGVCTPLLEDSCNCAIDCPPVCGNGTCDCNENCATCPGECGACPPGCGDGTCAPFVEDCGNCPLDCPCPTGTSCSGSGQCVAGAQCGDGGCNGGESCSSCPSDCGACPPACGDGTCAPFVEDCGNCLADCPCPSGSLCSGNVCVSHAQCGDGSCNGSETCSSCPADCGSCGPVCGDHTCTPVVEDCGNCPGDCPCWMPGTTCVGGQCVTYCGNGTCEPFVEDNCNCPADCPPVCGNGTCDCQETCSSCPSECGPCQTCGDGSCDYPEDGCSCPSDCGPCFP